MNCITPISYVDAEATVLERVHCPCHFMEKNLTVDVIYAVKRNKWLKCQNTYNNPKGLLALAITRFFSRFFAHSKCPPTPAKSTLSAFLVASGGVPSFPFVLFAQIKYWEGGEEFG